MSAIVESFAVLTAKHAKNSTEMLKYGTSGFREKATKLDSIAYRMGILAVCRSRNKRGQAIGLMLTASHNPEEDNGIKLIDPSGEMLNMEWEPLAQSIADVDDDNLEAFVRKIEADFKCADYSCKGLVLIACDTRPSSEPLAQSVMDGVRAIEGEYKNFGLLTTPQLHYIVNSYNHGEVEGKADEAGYYARFAKAFVDLNAHKANVSPLLYLDCANGIGAPKMKKLAEAIGDEKLLQIKYFNDGDGKLNYRCGADFVKIYQNFPDKLRPDAGVRCASFDGDADRLVYYYLSPETGKFVLLDGDKLAVLIMAYLQDLFARAKIADQLDFCVVQTAYANGSSTAYITESLKVHAPCVLTGVKHLDARARQSDVAVYFEANGHGTACFSEKVMKAIDALPADDPNANHLRSFVKLINQTTGDAMSDLLVIETILNNRGWTVEEWNKLYTDLPQRQVKVVVGDRRVIKTTDFERKCVAPVGLQERIDAIVESYGGRTRSFVRPSGTEDIVRVYAEAETQELADEVAEKVCSAVRALV